MLYHTVTFNAQMISAFTQGKPIIFRVKRTIAKIKTHSIHRHQGFEVAGETMIILDDKHIYCTFR